MFCVIVFRNMLPGISQGTPFNKKYLLNSLIINIEEIKVTLKKLLLTLETFKLCLSIKRGAVNTKVSMIVSNM